MSQNEKIYLMGFIFCIAAFASTNDWQTVVWGIGAIVFFGLFIRPTKRAIDEKRAVKKSDSSSRPRNDLKKELQMVQRANSEDWKINLTCPACGFSYPYPSDDVEYAIYEGRRIECVACHHDFHFCPPVPDRSPEQPLPVEPSALELLRRLWDRHPVLLSNLDREELAEIAAVLGERGPAN